MGGHHVRAPSFWSVLIAGVSPRGRVDLQLIAMSSSGRDADKGVRDAMPLGEECRSNHGSKSINLQASLLQRHPELRYPQLQSLLY